MDGLRCDYARRETARCACRCVVYDLENDLIKRGRVYFEMPALLQQLGVVVG